MDTKIVAVLFFLQLFVATMLQKAKAQDVEVSYQTFYDELAPYGQWVNDPQYGDVWIPAAAAGFRPYATDGHWVLTDDGNMWVSDVPWAWAGYHYGRWTYNSYYGWVWVPGYEWAPAWVSWRTGGGIYGWAPLLPGFDIGGVYDFPDNYWMFVNPVYLYSPNLYNYYEHGNVTTYLGQTQYLTYSEKGSRYYYGPRKGEIEKVTHQQVDVYHVSKASSAGAGHVADGHVSIYRPVIDKESVHTAHPASAISAGDHHIGIAQSVAADHESALPAFRTAHSQQVQQQRVQQPQTVAPPQRLHREQPQTGVQTDAGKQSIYVGSSQLNNKNSNTQVTGHTSTSGGQSATSAAEHTNSGGQSGSAGSGHTSAGEQESTGAGAHSNSKSNASSGSDAHTVSGSEGHSSSATGESEHSSTETTPGEEPHSTPRSRQRSEPSSTPRSEPRSTPRAEPRQAPRSSPAPSTGTRKH